MTDPLSLIPKESFTNHHVGKFAPKMNEAERCAILALARSGVRRERLAVAYGVDRRTIGHIVNDHSPRYKSVRAIYRAMGHEEFVKTYVTEDVALKIAAVPYDDAVKKIAEKPSASQRANRLGGVHSVQPAQCSYKHRVEVAYREDGEAGPGWYYRDTDSRTDPDAWYHNGDDSRKTSHACYDAMVENLMDD